MGKEIVATTAAPSAIGPYSQGVWAGSLLFVSGQTPIDPATGDVVKGSVVDQARQSFANVQAILKAAGLGMDKVVKSTLFIKDMNSFTDINKVYAEFFSTPYPARSCVEVARLPKDVLVELEVVASKD
ncbi:MAG: 2-iminobutanoate/2-iminopropanoate deaminase [Desulfovibrionales bacterium]|nr:2-iminobutanoate/2-iminopropanoate deaminase [Desulfovibrionales bacterium]